MFKGTGNPPLINTTKNDSLCTFVDLILLRVHQWYSSVFFERVSIFDATSNVVELLIDHFGHKSAWCPKKEDNSIFENNPLMGNKKKNSFDSILPKFLLVCFSVCHLNSVFNDIFQNLRRILVKMASHIEEIILRSMKNKSIISIYQLLYWILVVYHYYIFLKLNLWRQIVLLSNHRELMTPWKRLFWLNLIYFRLYLELFFDISDKIVHSCSVFQSLVDGILGKCSFSDTSHRISPKKRSLSSCCIALTIHNCYVFFSFHISILTYYEVWLTLCV